MTPECLTEAEWAAALTTLSAFPFFATPRFLHAWTRHHEPRARPRAWRLRAAGGAWRLAVGVEVPTSRYGTLAWLGTPEGGYCSAGAGEMPPAWLETLVHSLRQVRTDHVELVLGPEERAPDPMRAGTKIERRDTWIVDLSDGSLAWEARLDKRVRRQLRLCEAEGLRTARLGVEALDEFFDLYGRALSENPSRRVAYSRAFIADLLIDDGPGEAAVYLTRRQGQAMAGGVLLQGGRDALAWIGCFDRAHAHLHANLHRHATVIRDLAAAGATAYNLGAAAGLLEVARFKQKLGAVPHDWHRINWRNPTLARLRTLLGRGP